MRNVAIVVFDRVTLLGIATATDTLQIANRFIGNRIGQGPAVCETAEQPRHIAVHMLSTDGAPVTASCGFGVPVHGAADAAQPVFDLILIPAVEYADAQIFARTLKKMRALSDWLRGQHAAGAVLAATGSGVFALAEAGLLDRRVATIGRLLEKIFHRRYPAVRLKTAQAITEADNIFCASTVATGLPLLQRLLQRFTSPMIALQTRRALQLEDSIDGDELVAAPPERQTLESEIVAKSQYWLQQNLAGKARLAELAAYVAVSERTLLRHFKQALGVTPHAYLQNLRMETAKRFLERTDLRIDTVAERVGYGNVAFFRRAFRACIGTTPTAYRRLCARR